MIPFRFFVWYIIGFIVHCRGEVQKVFKLVDHFPCLIFLNHINYEEIE